MNVKYQSTGKIISLNENLKITAGGEGAIYQVPDEESLLAKIYHSAQIAEEQSCKLQTMRKYAPDDPMKSRSHTSIAWPVDLLLSADDKNTVVGFLMPRIDGTHPISFYYNVTRRHVHCPLFTYADLCHTASNLASVVENLHSQGYVIGDVNESNVLVKETALPTLVDTDSFQVRDPDSGKLYKCPVGKLEFTPRELQIELKSKSFREIERLPEHDLFGIGVLFFQLLMEGTQPFARIFTGAGDPPKYEEDIIQGEFPYGKHSKSLPPKLATPFAMLHPELQELFVRCFEDGHRDPKLRPDAQTWHNALKVAKQSLKVCQVNEQHFYFDHYPHCPWCKRTLQIPNLPLWDPFPSKFKAKYYAQQNYGIGWTAVNQSVPGQSTPQPLSFFQATPMTATIGQGVTLHWSIPNALQITVTTAAGKHIHTSNAAQGSVVVYPGKNTVYNIQAIGAGISIPGSVPVSVLLPQLPTSLHQVTELNNHLSLRNVSVKLASVLWLKNNLIKLFSPVKLMAYLNLNKYLSLNKISVALQPYIPFSQPPHEDT